MRLELSQEESARAVVRHGAVMRFTTGVTNDGRIVARDCQIFWDTGAYADAAAWLATGIIKSTSAGALALVGLAHLNHHIRDAESDSDAAFCQALADRCGLPALVADVDVPTEAARAHVSLEEAAKPSMDL